MESLAVGMSAFWYEMWWKNTSPKLDRETKLKIAQRISEISLKVPLYLRGIKIEKHRIPELAPHTSLEQFTGIQLYVVLTEISRELGLKVPSVSRLALSEETQVTTINSSYTKRVKTEERRGA